MVGVSYIAGHHYRLNGGAGMSRKLTGKQAAFVDAVANGVKPTPAARSAGYVVAKTDAYRLLRLPHVLEALQERRSARIRGDLASVALTTMQDLMSGDTPAATRYQASKWVLEHAGHHVDPDQDHQAKPLEEMDADELARAVSSGMSALQELAGQLQGSHLVEGEFRQLQDVAQVEEEDASFLD